MEAKEVDGIVLSSRLRMKSDIDSNLILVHMALMINSQSKLFQEANQLLI